MNILTLEQVNEVHEKNAIILANDSYWAKTEQGKQILVCPKECIITSPELLREEDSKIAEIPEPPRE